MKLVKHIALGIIILISIPLQAQVSVNVNIGPPPVWGPPVTVEEYYYLPDVESYYDIRTSQFIYLNNGTWIRAKSLPSRYRSYDLNRGNVIVLHDYHGPSPYVHYKTHKVKYVKKWHHDNGNHKGKGKHKNKR
jgi:hypothetical protein